MVKPYYTRKNLIVIALAFFYSAILVFTGMCIDGAHAIFNKKNIVNMIAQQLGFESIVSGTAGFVTLILIALYVLIFVALFLYERRYAIVNNRKKYSVKMLLLYFATLVVCLLLSLGVGLIIQTNLHKDLGILMKFLSQTIGLGTLIFIVIFGVVGFTAMLIVNFVSVDKPFKFWNKNEQVTVADELEAEESDVASSFDTNPQALEAAGITANGVTAVGSNNPANEVSSVKRVEELDDREKVFPVLSKMDIEYDGYAVEHMESDSYTLEEICQRFRNYLAVHEKLYFDEDTIRFFISGLGTSHFMILEGLSGTGKSSLPRYFAKFCNANLLFVPVQTTWRDRTNLFGYFNDFSKTYTETDFLLNLYHANYNPDQIHMFVLDEMNISRVEYYFADLLSVLEYPVDEWKLRLLQLPYGFIPPAKLDDGFIKILENCYFVGTANKDDSTFSITDKVYDRAITINFDYRNTPFEAKGESDPISLSQSKLQGLFNDALEITENQLNAEDREKLNTITDFIYEQFDLTFGNRILNQVEKLIPIFVACGGKKENALDFLLTVKVISKLEGRFEEYVKGALKDLQALLVKTYGKNVFKLADKAINVLIRRL